ncbi:hypothetical protein D3C77_629850 [compost metagenome]
MHGQAQRGGIRISHAVGDHRAADTDMRVSLKRGLQALHDQARIAAIGVDLVEQQPHRRQGHANAAVGLQLFKQAQRAPAQLARGEHFWWDRAQGAIGGEDDHLHDHAARTLGVDDQHIVMILQGRQ